MRSLDQFYIKEIQIYSNLDREREKEWGLGKSIHYQKFRLSVAEHPHMSGGNVP
jgi:hypothetical protein